MKKIIFIVDYLHNEPNSVSSILNNILNLNNSIAENVVVHHQGNQEGSFDVCEVDGVKTYCAKHYSKIQSFIKRINGKINGRKEQSKCNEEFIRKIVEKERPNLVFFLLYSPEVNYVKICEELAIPYIYMLYDTYIGRPELDCNVIVAKEHEKKVIDSSVAYFVPSFFYKDYKLNYDSNKVISYDLPLLVDLKSVEQSYARSTKKYNYTYFGQIQSFRNSESIRTIFRALNLKLDVFTQSDIEEDDVFAIHSTVTGDDLNDVVSHSSFLIAFDNSPPYEWYLPSKVYLYVSFSKPVIAFGDNKDSALRRFFQNYPYFYYQNIHDDTDGLVDFIRRHLCVKFDKNVYNSFINFLPENALAIVSQTIKSVLDS